MTRTTSRDSTTTLALLELVGVERWFGDIHALGPCDLALHPSEITVLVGPNGAGKTTLLRILARQLEPTEGQVLLDGRSTTTRTGRDALRHAVAHASSLPVVYPELTVREHLQLVALAYGSPGGEARIDELLTAFGLGPRDHFLPDELSTGMLQKLHLAAAFLRPSRLLLLDEPARGLDRDARAALWDLLAAHRDRGGSALIATHTPPPAGTVDRGLVLTDGELSFDGAPEAALRELDVVAGGEPPTEPAS